MKNREKIKRKVGALMIILMVSTVTLMTGPITTVMVRGALRLMIERARKQLLFWGGDYNPLSHSPSLDPAMAVVEEVLCLRNTLIPYYFSMLQRNLIVNKYMYSKVIFRQQLFSLLLLC